MRLILTIIALLALPALAHADPVALGMHRFVSGTGFFVNNEGYLVTNNHVVKGCTQVVVKSEQYPETTGDVRATDAEHDLALIQVSAPPPRIADLRENLTDMAYGNPVYVIGYPGEAAKTGIYKIVDASLMSIKGPRNHPDWIVFSDAAQHGNSGGPLLDSYGNVVGVVVAKAQLSRDVPEINPATGQAVQSDTVSLAIGLPTVEAFLASQSISYSNVLSGNMAMHSSDYAIERIARDYIVNVQCHTPAEQ